MEAKNTHSQNFSVAIVYDPIFTLHSTGNHHVESSSRLDSIIQKLIDANFMPIETNPQSETHSEFKSPYARNMPAHLISPRRASIEDLKLAHSLSYISLVRNESNECKEKEIKTLSTGDVEICNRSYDVACFAVGAILSGIDAVMQNQFDSAFCIVRPPGHHALRDKGMGFCLFNNVAIGAFYLLDKYLLNRVLIVDWDLHHGNGTEELVKNDPRIFYFSTHQSPLWPLTGKESEKGCGNILNVEIKPGINSRAILLDAYAKKLAEAMEVFRPEFVLISAGFDAHELDPLGQLNLKSKDFFTLTLEVKKIAERHANGRIVSTLEGGYNLEMLAESSYEHVKGLAHRRQN